MGEMLKRVLLVQLVEETRWRAKRQVAASSNTSYVAGGNLPTFGVMIPQEIGIRAGGSINDKQPKKGLRNLNKSTQCRELRLLIPREESFR